MSQKTTTAFLYNEIEKAYNTIYNLRLYLHVLKERYVAPDDWAAFEKEFDGLAGYVETKDLTEAQND